MLQKAKKIGLTGGIGSGKTLISKAFSLLNIPIFLSDLEAKKLYDDPDIKTQVIKLLGQNSYKDNKLNREFVGKSVFAEAKKLEQLNNIIHPAVRQRFTNWVSEQSSPYVIQESALIFETGIAPLFDYTILVTAPEEVRLDRVTHRDNSTRDQVIARMNHQLSDEKKIAQADYIIINDGKEFIIPQIIEVHRQLLSINESK